MLTLLAGSAISYSVGPSLVPSPRVAAQARFPQVAMAEPDFDLVIVGCGVGGHGAALHAVSKGLKVAVVAGEDVGGTCVNRGCVPSKALLAAAGRVREMGDEKHLADLGITVGGVEYDREKVAAHANNLASKVAKNLGGSLVALGIETFMEKGELVGATEVKLVGNPEGKTITGKNVILATGSVPFVPPGVEVDGKTVFTSDEALKLEWVPDWIAIIGSGYIGLEFSDVYTALGSEVTFIEAMPRIMFFFDKQIAQLAERLLIRPRNIDYRTNVFASKVTPGIPGVKPVVIEMIDANTKELVETLEVRRAPDPQTEASIIPIRGVLWGSQPSRHARWPGCLTARACSFRARVHTTHSRSPMRSACGAYRWTRAWCAPAARRFQRASVCPPSTSTCRRRAASCRSTRRCRRRTTTAT